MVDGVKHTPGPWKADVCETEVEIYAERGPAGNRYPALDELYLYFDLSKTEHPITAANARLIAAAPELLEAAKRLEAEFGLALSKKTMESVAFARAAVAKAEGRA